MSSLEVTLRLIATFVGFFALPSALYAYFERRHRAPWPAEAGPRTVASAGAYRSGSVEGLEGRRRAPLLVRGVAFSSFVLGQMVVPGFFLGLMGLFVYGVGLTSIPGLIVAARTLRIGPDLLAAKPGTARRARDLARWTERLNVVVTIVTLLLAGGFLASNPREWHFAAGWLAILPYAAISFAYAHHLRKAADVVEPLEAERAAGAAALPEAVLAAIAASHPELAAAPPPGARFAPAEPAPATGPEPDPELAEATRELEAELEHDVAPPRARR